MDLFLNSLQARLINNRLRFLLLMLVVCAHFIIGPAVSAEFQPNSGPDEKVRRFLENSKDRWRDWNIPYADGKVLFDLIIENNYTKALEIGTSTGHSAIWIAWALSKTGGKLITIEIDEQRHRQALVNFKEAGLSDYIDARLADAHQLVQELKGPFDFVFSDADKDWYKNYFMLLSPKLAIGGAFAAHNASNRAMVGVGEFLDYVEGLPNYKTRIDTTSKAGISISIKTAEK